MTTPEARPANASARSSRRDIRGVVARARVRSDPDGALGRLAPQLLEPGELARVGREDVDDHVEVVHEDPARLTEAFDPPREQAVLLLHPLVDAVVDRLGLAVGVARAEEEVGGVAQA